MSASVFLIVRIVFAWFGALVVAGIMWAQLFGSVGPVFALASLALMTLAFMSAVTHVRRVRLIAGRLDHTTLSTRQRRQIEVPLDVQASFAVMEAAVRALPRVQDIECAPGSLLIRAKVRKIGRYDGRQPSHNQVLVTIAPGQGTSSVTVLCEPDAGAWVDLFAVDEGSNYENAEAINRAVVRRVGEQRRDEQAAAEQSVMEKELAVARLNLLHAQVEPHFLYNTLASAQVLARTDPPRAEVMIGHLIQYLRSSLPSADGAIATLGEELERTQAYLEILRIRMGARLALQVEVPYELRGLQLPSMMLQTLVENAIKHGLEPKPGGGTVWILARRHDDHATLTVADDGQGFNPRSQGTGIGLKNLRERLQLIYAGKASFAIVSNFPSGVAATITLPLPAQPTGPRPPPLPDAATAVQVRA
ncbi:sensor histidine kinase [Xanthomonas pisi]|uniref:Sensor histidine kinase n=1 Tax=Xanthomonas pisi TaxID=56457 RepID=A0A2S7D2B9_9XANT|nr:histidine kinase [Xanthomonas pisi]KLD69809.1 histidine kinase [Xanthomonas pisi DSM 18956]PPU67960.1 sensor histidine kinase [Xanthomonas pisi]